MIVQRFKANQEYQGQKLLFLTELFGKAYFWMQDVEGTTYLLPVGDDGLPDFS